MDYDNFSDSRRASEALRRSRRAREARQKRRKKLLIRRTIIVLVMLLIVFLVIFLLVSLFKAIFSPKDGAATLDEAAASETVAATEANALEFEPPALATVGKDKGHYSSSNGGVYIYDRAAYELFGGSESSAGYYADCISDLKKAVGKDVTVYNMVIPNHTEFGLPRELITDGTVATQIQADNIRQIFSGYSADVVPINCYNKLSEHVNEYIYFNTDHHWTGLGAYYAYAAFTEQTGQRTLSLDVCTEHTIEGFEGTLIDYDSALRNNLDTVHFWTFPYETSAKRTDESGEVTDTTVYYEDEGSGPYAYGVFIFGDSPLFVEYNHELSNGKKIAVIKESYGNALAPYLTANYEEVHVMDMRTFGQNLVTYCKENGIDEILVANNVMAANTAVQVDRIRALFS